MLSMKTREEELLSQINLFREALSYKGEHWNPIPASAEIGSHTAWCLELIEVLKRELEALKPRDRYDDGGIHSLAANERVESEDAAA